MNRKPVSAIALLLLMASCAASSQTDLSDEVHSRVRVGMPLDAAAAALLKSGFECGENDLSRAGSADLVCSRSRSHRTLATCVQRVVITAPPPARTVSRIEVPDPACAGF